MTKRTLAALKKSIEHWSRLATGAQLQGEGVGPDHCALCKIFLVAKGGCDGCPVKERTGHPTCTGTPYGKADNLYRDGLGANDKRFKQAAKRELKFLESLLP